MVSTRSSQGSPQSPPPSTKKGTKRSSDNSLSRAAKRGKTTIVAKDLNEPKNPRGRKKKQQKTIEETMKDVDSIDNGKDVPERIDSQGDVIRADDIGEVKKVKRARGRPKKQQKVIGESSKDKDTIEDNNGVTDKIEDKEQNGDAIEDDNGVTEHIKDKTEQNGNSRAKENDREEELNAHEDAVRECEESIAKTVQNSRGMCDDENEKTDVGANNMKNSLDEVKADTDELKADAGDFKEAANAKQDEKSANIAEHNESVVEDEKREAIIPSSILEKGIIYLFFRSRVNVEDPQGIEDVARSYIVLRPLPLGAKINKGPLEDPGNARLLALPKKRLPKSKTDRFLMFVEKSNEHIKDLREQFAGNEYATKTVGTSHTQAATPFAEGIYAITSTGSESHLAYHITIPQEMGEIQQELGLNTKGSYVLSVKNPEAPGPANATIGKPAKYSTEIQEKFRGRRWMPLEPEVLEYEGTQFLIIGESLGEFGRAVEEVSRDKKDGEKEKPEEELEKLEEEDHDRVEHLREDDPIFADLGLSSKEYPHLQTTW